MASAARSHKTKTCGWWGTQSANTSCLSTKEAYNSYRDQGRPAEGIPAKAHPSAKSNGKPNDGPPGGGDAMKKRLDKKTLEKEALFWSKRKNVLDRDEVKACRK